MDSSTARRQTEERKQAEIRRQIAALQAQLKEVPATEEDVPATPKKRKQQGSTLLAPGTPSPRKKRRNEDPPRQASVSRPTTPPVPRVDTIRDSQARHNQTKVAKPAAPSTVLSKLASLSTGHADEDPDYTQVRSEGFLERVPAKEKEDSGDGGRATRREEDLTVIEDLEPGPYEHKAPFDDPHFQKLEPHSGIRLSSRAIPHDEFQDYLRGRYYLSPSRLYSVIRLLPSKQGYDVPVEGDWVTIAVIAERGPLRYSKAPVDAVKEEPGDDLKSLSLDTPTQSSNKPWQNQWKGKAKAKEEPSKPSGKRYINLKLIDFGCRSSSATSQKSTIRGDAFLSLLLFESDSVEEVVRVDDEGREKKEKVYRGGSRGAFERMAKLKEGAVVALLNPKILRPFQRASDTPHPTDNILALTPTSLSSVCIIGHSLDLGMCAVVKRDGKACGSWCDKRVSEVCEWHVQHAVQGKRAGRAEFSMGTSGMTTAPKRRPAYDPSRQWGLQPSSHPSSTASADATYIVSGHIVSNSTSTQSLFVSENVGRDAQARAARKAREREEEGVLMEGLRRRDREGVRVLWAAREFAEKAKLEGKKGKGKAKKKSKEKGKGMAKGKDAKGALESSSEDEDKDEKEEDKEEGEGKGKLKSAYSATLIRTLGFDPTGRRKGATAKDVQDKLSALASIHAKKKVGDVRLGPRPGGKRSSVVAPPESSVRPSTTQEKTQERAASPEPSLDFPDSSDSDEEVRRPVGRGGKRELEKGVTEEKEAVGMGMVNLDSSDVE